jgi:hypothetical protein
MHVIRIHISELQSRGNRIREILEPISNRRATAWKPISSSRRWIIGVHEGAPPVSDYRGWRFSTILPGFLAQYFEWWLRSDEDGQEYWYLDRAYLNIYQFDKITGGETKFLCLHCDPNLIDTDSRDDDEEEGLESNVQQPSSHVEYKKIPHIHIKQGAAKAPFPTKAHITLNIGYSEQVLYSIESLSEAMELAVLMLREEVFDRMRLI